MEFRLLSHICDIHFNRYAIVNGRRTRIVPGEFAINAKSLGTFSRVSRLTPVLDVWQLCFNHISKMITVVRHWFVLISLSLVEG